MQAAGADSMPKGVERQGIGTPATRAATIEKLVQKGFLERKGSKKTKVLLPTDKGKAMITVMPEEIQSPEMTADWETKLLRDGRVRLKDCKSAKGKTYNATVLLSCESDGRKAIQEVSLQHLDTIPQSGVRRRRIWDDSTIPRDDVRLINSHYDDLYRVPNHGVIQVDRSDGSSYTARVEHLDDYHFNLGEYGNVYHIAQFGEMIERTGSTAYPEVQTQDEQGAWELGGKGYLAIQSCEDGWDYTLYHSDFSVMDGGQLDEPELTIQEVREQILEVHHMEKGRRLLKDYDLIMDKAAEADELNLSGKPSTLEKLAALAKCDAPECNPTVCRKARAEHEL